MQRYNDNLSLWQSQSIVNYQFDFTNDWYCHEDSEAAQTIFVQEWEPSNENGFTIDDLFLEVKEPIELNAYVLDVEYDSQYGFPVRVEFDKYYSISDDAWCYVLGGFQVRDEW